MGYWSVHPMCGDHPMDCESTVQDYAFECLLSDLNAEKSTGEKNEKIKDELRNFVSKFDSDEDFLENYYIEEDIPLTEVLTTYKYEIINNFLNEEEAFVVPFMFIDNGIDVKEDYVKYLIEMLGDGDASHRGYDEWEEGNSNHPYYYVNLVKKYSECLFNENNKDLQNIEFLKEHGQELKQIEPQGLFETIFESLESNKKGLVNVD